VDAVHDRVSPQVDSEDEAVSEVRDVQSVLGRVERKRVESRRASAQWKVCDKTQRRLQLRGRRVRSEHPDYRERE
jgi:hypothetical protein